jgi:hypothetical protein
MNFEALTDLWNLTQRHPGTSGARAAIGVLLGLYNGRRFPMDLTDLRSLDVHHKSAAFAVLKADASYGQREVHQWLNEITGRQDFGARFEQLAHDYKLKGKCGRENLSVVTPASLIIE